MSYIKLPILPGVFKDDTPLAAKGYAIDCDKMRVVRQKWQTIGGWEIATDDTFNGICRGLFSWRDGDSQSYTAIGTHTHLQVYHDGEIYDNSPVETFGTASDPFTTTDESDEIGFALTSHGMVDGQRIRFPNSTTVNGADISATSGYEVTVVDTDNVTFTATSAATSSGSGVGGTVDYDIFLAPGLVDNLGGPGFGVGGFGTGGYGQGSSETVFYPRTWTFDNWGQNLIACPRGGKIYEWAPAFSASELVTNGDFATDSDWTKGTGWTITGGEAVATSGASSNLEQTLVLAPGAWFLLEFDVTRTAGTITPKIGTTSIGDAISASGRYRRAFYTDSGNLIFDKDDTFEGSIDNVSVKQMLNAYAIPNAPSENTAIFITAERILVAIGSEEETSGDFNPLLVRWSDQNAHHTWTTSDDNVAGEQPLAKGGRIVCGLAGRGENYVWTDKGQYIMRFVPDLTVVYSFTHTGAGCGPISSHGAIMLAGNAYWMANTGEFFRYTGSSPEPLHCTVRRDIFDNLAPSQGEKVYAFANSAFKEVGWLYPDFRDGNECTRYVIYNTAENVWYTGTFDRTAWVDSGRAQYPIAVDTSGNVYFQEKGKSDNGSALSWFLETAAFDLGDGNFLARIMGIIPDFEDMVGGCTLTTSTYLYPASAPVTQSASLTSATERADLRGLGRQISMRFAGNAAPAFARMGEHRCDIRQTRMTR